MVKRKTCNSCDYFDFDGYEIGLSSHLEGFCRKNSPRVFQLNAGSNFHWPVVTVDDWCGEWYGPDADLKGMIKEKERN